jgi:hypothetical protein
MRDAITLALLVLAFATLVTTHVAIALRLVLRATPRYRGLVALLVPPLAPYWAWTERWRKLSTLWVGAVVLYALLVAVAAS